MLFHHEDPPAHTFAHFSAQFIKLGYELGPHPSYLLNLDTWDFFSFQTRKRHSPDKNLSWLRTLSPSRRHTLPTLKRQLFQMGWTSCNIAGISVSNSMAIILENKSALYELPFFLYSHYLSKNPQSFLAMAYHNNTIFERHENPIRASHRSLLKNLHCWIGEQYEKNDGVFLCTVFISSSRSLKTVAFLTSLSRGTKASVSISNHMFTRTRIYALLYE